MPNRIDYNHKCLRVASKTLAELHVLMDTANGGKSSRKIQAIKLLRNETKCGLKEAKLAIERKFQPSLAHNTEALDIRPLMCIKSVTVDFGEGDIKLDLEPFSDNWMPDCSIFVYFWFFPIRYTIIYKTKRRHILLY